MTYEPRRARGIPCFAIDSGRAGPAARPLSIAKQGIPRALRGSYVIPSRGEREESPASLLTADELQDLLVHDSCVIPSREDGEESPASMRGSLALCGARDD